MYQTSGNLACCKARRRKCKYRSFLLQKTFSNDHLGFLRSQLQYRPTTPFRPAPRPNFPHRLLSMLRLCHVSRSRPRISAITRRSPTRARFCAGSSLAWQPFRVWYRHREPRYRRAYICGKRQSTNESKYRSYIWSY